MFTVHGVTLNNLGMPYSRDLYRSGSHNPEGKFQAIRILRDRYFTPLVNKHNDVGGEDGVSSLFKGYETFIGFETHEHRGTTYFLVAIHNWNWVRDERATAFFPHEFIEGYHFEFIDTPVTN